MGIAEIIIIVVCVAVVIAVGVSIVVAKRKGKPSCCSDCAGCPHAKACTNKSGREECCCGEEIKPQNNASCCCGHCENKDNQNTGK